MIHTDDTEKIQSIIEMCREQRAGYVAELAKQDATEEEYSSMIGTLAAVQRGLEEAEAKLVEVTGGGA